MTLSFPTGLAKEMGSEVEGSVRKEADGDGHCGGGRALWSTCRSQ